MRDYDSKKDAVFELTVKSKHRGKELDRSVLEVEVVGTKMYARTLGSSSVSARIDVTPLWSFFKQVRDFQDHKDEYLSDLTTQHHDQ